MMWFRRKLLVASGASSESPIAPFLRPIAFQVQTVSGLVPDISRTWPLTRPWQLITHTQSSSPMPSLVAVAGLM